MEVCIITPANREDVWLKINRAQLYAHIMRGSLNHIKIRLVEAGIKIYFESKANENYHPIGVRKQWETIEDFIYDVQHTEKPEVLDRNGLKYCPFCGKRPKPVCGEHYFFIGCDCGVIIRSEESIEDARSKWNRRINDD